MSNDALYNFSNKINNEDVSLKLNIDELYEKKKQQDLNVLDNYNKILIRIHNKIKYVSKNLANEQCCWYVMPEILIGIPKYNKNDCIIYVINKLRDDGFIVKYIHPNLLFISWKSWIPTYVRNEIKKKTGQTINEYGNVINKKTSYEDENEDNHNDINDDNIDSIIFNKKSNNDGISISKNSGKNNKNNSNYKDINSYKPQGVYNDNLFKKLNLN